MSFARYQPTVVVQGRLFRRDNLTDFTPPPYRPMAKWPPDLMYFGREGQPAASMACGFCLKGARPPMTSCNLFWIRSPRSFYLSSPRMGGGLLINPMKPVASRFM